MTGTLGALALFLLTLGPTFTSLVHGASRIPMVPVRADGIGLLHTFQGAPDGDGPESQLALGPAGMIYGTTVVGGDGGCNSPIGCGTIYGVVPSGSGNLDEILYSFKGGADGFQPYGGVIADAQGALYGTTTDGGTPIAPLPVELSSG